MKKMRLLAAFLFIFFATEAFPDIPNTELECKTFKANMFAENFSADPFYQGSWETIADTAESSWQWIDSEEMTSFQRERFIVVKGDDNSATEAWLFSPKIELTLDEDCEEVEYSLEFRFAFAASKRPEPDEVSLKLCPFDDCEPSDFGTFWNPANDNDAFTPYQWIDKKHYLTMVPKQIAIQFTMGPPLSTLI